MKKEKFEKDSLLELFKEKGLKKMELSTIVGGIRDTLPPPPITWEDTGNACDPDRPNV